MSGEEDLDADGDAEPAPAGGREEEGEPAKPVMRSDGDLKAEEDEEEEAEAEAAAEAQAQEEVEAREAEEEAGEEVEDEEEPDDGEEEEERDGGAESVTVEITGLSLYTHHGVSAAEQEVGQRLVIDIRLELGESDATLTDRVEDTVDYGEVCQLVALIAQQRSHRTLERLCSTIADRLLADYELEAVWVKASKPEPPIPLPVSEVSVEVWREAEE
jgi:dihydroneopterin aldolase